MSGEWSVRGGAASAAVGRTDVLSTGRSDRPVVVLVAGWKARFIFEPLVERIPAELGVVVISLYPTSDTDLTAIIDDIPRSVDYVDDTLRALPDGLDRRPLAILGYSRSGLVAHEVASRLRADGRDVLVHVLVDTVFPGREVARGDARSRGRAATYRTLLSSGRYDAVAKRLRNAADARGRRTARRVGTILLRTTGVPETSVVERGRVRLLTEDDYAPGSVTHPVLVYRASLSDPTRTTERWREVVPHLEEVVVAGEHGGDEGVLGRNRIDQIAADLSRRLGGLR